MKPQLAIHWGAACGGCDVSLLDTHGFLLELGRLADIRYWPFATDGRTADLEALPDGSLDVALYSGAIRNDHDEALAHLLRRKARLLVAFGACAHIGGIPGLANLDTKEQILGRIYLGNPTLEPGNRTVPHSSGAAGDEGDIPRFYRRVYRLAALVEVDYFLPGCPPDSKQVEAALRSLISGELPERGSVLGAGERALCDECPRERRETPVERFRRPHEFVPDPHQCLLEQGLLCCGIATREGCGAQCPSMSMPCRGCFGPAPGVLDQGAKLATAIAALLRGQSPAEIERTLAGLPDFAGYAYRFSLPASLLQRSVRR